MKNKIMVESVLNSAEGYSIVYLGTFCLNILTENNGVICKARVGNFFGGKS